MGCVGGVLGVAVGAFVIINIVAQEVPEAGGLGVAMVLRLLGGRWRRQT